MNSGVKQASKRDLTVDIGLEEKQENRYNGEKKDE